MHDKGSKIQRFVANLRAGSVSPGSNAPVEGVPKWVTPVVIKGGFANGDFSAGGDLLPHEVELGRELLVDSASGVRLALNRWHLSARGLQRLSDLLASGEYEVDVAEEAALLAVAWLVGNDRHDLAEDVVRSIEPFFGRIRFFPRPTPGAQARRTDEHGTFVRPISDAIAALERKVGPNANVLAFLARCTVLDPHFDAMLGLVLETYEEDWPMQTFPQGWAACVGLRLACIQRDQDAHRWLCPPDSHSGRSFKHLLDALRKAESNDPADPLTGRDVGYVRAVVAQVRGRRGLPGEAAHEVARAAKRRIADAVVDAIQAGREGRASLLAAVRDELHGATGGGAKEQDVAGRMGLPPDAIERVVGAAAAGRVHKGALAAVRGCVQAPLGTLVALGLVKSAEQLALPVSRLAADARAGRVADPALRRLVAATLRSFDRRRSLLLLDLASQVRVCDLPWYAAVFRAQKDAEQEREELERRTSDNVPRHSPQPARGPAASAAALELLKQAARAYVEAFPDVQLPNKLVGQLEGLARAAGLSSEQLPLTKEIAAYIFQGRFGPSFSRAVTFAADRLPPAAPASLYSRYYVLDGLARVAEALDANVKNPSVNCALDEWCAARLGPRDMSRKWWRSVADNGAIVEQQMIATTHGLLPLLELLGLDGARLLDVARRCFSRLRAPAPGKAYLHARKDFAYGFRQMVLFLSLAGPEHQAAFFDELPVSEDLPEPVAAALLGLESAFRSAAGGADAPSAGAHHAPLYGWC